MSAQDYTDDPRNETILVHLNGELVPRDEAKVSVFDAGFVLGDGLWEGLRLHKGAIVFLEQHLDRLFRSARSVSLDIGRTQQEVTDALYDLCAANKMQDGVHIRLMVTRGIKKTVNQDPTNAIGPATLVIVAEHKLPPPELLENGLKLFTVPFRCSSADVFDAKLNSHSRLMLVNALAHAQKAGADEALMLDPLGFVGTCNSTNFFWVRGDRVFTSSGKFCFNGCTRQNVIDICAAEQIECVRGDFSLTDVYGADEAFVTGTFGGLIPASEIDGIAMAQHGERIMTERLTRLYDALKDEVSARSRRV